MVKSLKHRLSGEGGFTLIELLIVMIIISILMAVAIPVFLGQKQKALGTSAKANLTLAQKTMESCAASTITGTFMEAGAAPICNEVSVKRDEPSLTPAIDKAAAAAGSIDITTIDEETYTMNAYPQMPAKDLMMFRLTRGPQGVVKSCETTGAVNSVATRDRLCQKTAAAPSNNNTGYTW